MSVCGAEPGRPLPAIATPEYLRYCDDHWNPPIRLDSNDYSIHPSVVGRRVEIIADLDRVGALCDGKTVADHQRIWAAHQTISDPEHTEAAKALRRTRIGLLRPAPEPEVQIRCLDDYDTALGVGTGESEVAS